MRPGLHDSAENREWWDNTRMGVSQEKQVQDEKKTARIESTPIRHSQQRKGERVNEKARGGRANARCERDKDRDTWESRQTDTQTRTDRHTHPETEAQTDRQTERQTDRERHTHVHRHRHTHTHTFTHQDTHIGTEEMSSHPMGDTAASLSPKDIVCVIAKISTTGKDEVAGVQWGFVFHHGKPAPGARVRAVLALDAGDDQLTDNPPTGQELHHTGGDLTLWRTACR